MSGKFFLSLLIFYQSLIVFLFSLSLSSLVFLSEKWLVVFESNGQENGTG